MRKNIALPLFTAVAGGIGLYLNLSLHNAVDPITLLYPTGCIYPTLMVALAVVVFVALLVTLRNANPPQTFPELIYSPSNVTTTFQMAGAFLLLCGGGLMALELMRRINADIRPLAGAPTLVIGLCALVSLPAGICILAMLKHMPPHTTTEKLPIFAVIVAFAPMPWLLFCYQESVLVAHIALYANQLMAFCFSQLSLYHIAFSAYESPRPRTIVVCSLMTVYFTLTSLSLGQPLHTTATLLGFMLIALASAISVIGTCYPPYHKPPTRVIFED